jgi:hypothetical protein
VALTFLPCDSAYTHHHLRRDVYRRVIGIGLPWTGRYIAPTAHVTIARFIDADVVSRVGMQGWVEGLEELRAECRQWQGQWRLSEGVTEVLPGARGTAAATPCDIHPTVDHIPCIATARTAGSEGLRRRGGRGRT